MKKLKHREIKHAWSYSKLEGQDSNTEHLSPGSSGLFTRAEGPLSVPVLYSSAIFLLKVYSITCVACVMNFLVFIHYYFNDFCYFMCACILPACMSVSETHIG